MTEPNREALMRNQTDPTVIGLEWRIAIKVVPRKASFVLGKGMKGPFLVALVRYGKESIILCHPRGRMTEESY